MKYNIEKDKFDNYIITKGDKYTWKEAVQELIRLHNIRSNLWKKG